MKYIIDIPEDAEYGILTYRRVDGGFCTKDIDITETEQLTSDYINEHFSDLQDEAYQRGLKDGRNETWECMKRIAFLEKPRDMRDFFGHTTFGGILTGYTATEVIEKLKAYEEKQKADDEIKVGDEVRLCRHNVPYIVTSCDGDDDTYILMTVSGRFIKAGKYNVRKTGRHFDIQSILEEMRT